MKNSVNEVNSALESTGNRADRVEERTGKLEDRNPEIFQVEKEK